MTRLTVDKRVSNRVVGQFLRGNGIAFLVLILLPLLLYLRTLAPDVVDADGGEFQFGAWNFSFVHPTGYPLFLILGGLFQHVVPIGNPAWRLNLFTALTAVMAVVALYLVILELTGHRGASLLAALSFSVTRTFWFDAVGAEAYDLYVFFVALLLLLALRWQAKPSANRFAVFSLVYGLALTHHRSIILWIPAFVLFFAVAKWQTRPVTLPARWVARLVTAAVLFLIPLVLYVYIPLRAPVAPYANLTLAPGSEVALYDNTPVGFVNYVLGRAFQYEIEWDAVGVTRLLAVPQLVLEQFGVVGALLGIIGLGIMLARKEWAKSALLVAGLVATVLFASIYHIGDIFHYYIPLYLVWAIWIGIALERILNSVALRAGASLQSRRRVVPVIVFALAFVVLVIPQLIVNLPVADRSQEKPREQWSSILSSSIPHNAILISNDRDEMMPFWYMQYVENTRRDLLGLFPLLTPEPRFANIARLTDTALQTGRPVYLIKPMPGLEVKYALDKSSLPVIQVLGSTADITPQHATNFAFADRIRILGYDLAIEADRLNVSVYYQPRTTLDGDYTSFVQLMDAGGKKIAQGSDHKLGGDYYPTSIWQVGEVLRDEQTIALSSGTGPGAYRLVVGMYRALDSEPIGDPVEIGTVQVQ